MLINAVRQEQLNWLEKHNIKYVINQTVVSPTTLQPIPYRIFIDRDEDIVLFSLKWL